MVEFLAVLAFVFGALFLFCALETFHLANVALDGEDEKSGLRTRIGVLEDRVCALERVLSESLNGTENTIETIEPRWSRRFEAYVVRKPS